MILDALKQRLRTSLARPAPSAADLAVARGHADALREDGTWSGLNGFVSSPDRRASTAHLERLVTLARARASCAGELDAALVRALDGWLAHDPPAPDPWQHQIAVPRLVGTTAFLCQDLLSPGARGKVDEILARPRWTRWHGGAWAEWSGTHLAAVAFNVLLRGCLAGDMSSCQEAFERVHAAVRYASEGEDGIQADRSFRQDDASTPAGRYGLAFGEDVARFLVLGHGTAWQAPAPCLALFASFLLDGQQWLIRRRFFDAGLSGESAPSGTALDGFAAAIEELAALGATPRRSEMAAFARRLRAPAELALSGHRHFWRAGLAVHQRPAFYASVRMGVDQPADGLTCLLQRGDEYDGAVAWDRRRLPGTTALQVADTRLSSGTSPAPERRPLAGSVTDGEYGVTAAELHRGGVTGRKTWFYFDGCVVCLGSGIACEEAAGAVFTSVNQCRARETATAYGKGGETHALAPGKSYDLSAAYRIEHDGFAYGFPEPMPVRAKIGPQEGTDVFSLWIDHGVQPRHESYAYIVLPVADPDGRRTAEHGIAQVKILANTPACQAVWHQELRLVGIVFWEPGVIALPTGGRVAVTRPCVLLGQDRSPGETRLSIANPVDGAATIHVEYANRCLCFNLPAGPRGGQSVTRVL